MKYERLKADLSGEEIFGARAFKDGEGVWLKFTTDRECRELFLKLWLKKTGNFELIRFDEEFSTGSVRRLSIRLNESPELLYYNYVADGKEFTDIYARETDAPCKWQGGHTKEGRVTRGVIRVEDRPEAFSKRAQKPRIPYEDMIIYRLHARGFTEHGSSGVEPAARGRFSGISEKIGYLKDLGINVIELLPVCEFNESFKKGVFEELPSKKDDIYKVKEDTRTDYWGFTDDARAFAVKNAFGGPEGFGSLVEKLHENDMELIQDIYFSGKETVSYVLSVLRYYVTNFNPDGFHLIGYAPMEHILSDPFLKDTKLWADNIPEGSCDGGRVAAYNDGFSIDIRRYLKGDEGMLLPFVERNKEASPERARINYVANVNGFNLRDMVSYDRKHNEENGENNLDGTDSNFSWNCGVEGKTSGKKIKALRLRQMKNALLMLFMSQGAPLILSGDEMGHTKNGNNNSYCRDDLTEWINWRDAEKNEDFSAFVKKLISFRKSHRIFSLSKAITNTDYRRTGLPDVSYHGEGAWKAEFEPFRRNIGILFNEAYGSDEALKGELIYVAFNMHWEPHTFSLPDPEYGQRAKKTNSDAKSPKKWYKIIDTFSEDSFIEGELTEDREVAIKERSISVFITKQGD